MSPYQRRAVRPAPEIVLINAFWFRKAVARGSKTVVDRPFGRLNCGTLKDVTMLAGRLDCGAALGIATGPNGRSNCGTVRMVES